MTSGSDEATTCWQNEWLSGVRRSLWYGSGSPAAPGKTCSSALTSVTSATGTDSWWRTSRTNRSKASSDAAGSSVPAGSGDDSSGDDAARERDDERATVPPACACARPRSVGRDSVAQLHRSRDGPSRAVTHTLLSSGNARSTGSAEWDVVPRAPFVVGARAVPAAVALGDGDVVDAGLTTAHEAALVELPQLVAVAAEPLAGGVVPLVLEADGDAVVGGAPQALAQHVVELALPLAGQEVDDLRPAGEELVAVPPDRVLGVGQAHPVGIAGVPGVLGGLHLGQRGVAVERRERRGGGGYGGGLPPSGGGAPGPRPPRGGP